MRLLFSALLVESNLNSDKYPIQSGLGEYAIPSRQVDSDESGWFLDWIGIELFATVF